MDHHECRDYYQYIENRVVKIYDLVNNEESFSDLGMGANTAETVRQVKNWCDEIFAFLTQLRILRSSQMVVKNYDNNIYAKVKELSELSTLLESRLYAEVSLSMVTREVYDLCKENEE